MATAEKAVPMVVVEEKHDPDINTSILRNMEHESMCYWKMHYNEGLGEDKVVVTVVTVATEEIVVEEKVMVEVEEVEETEEVTVGEVKEDWVEDTLHIL